MKRPAAPGVFGFGAGTRKRRLNIGAAGALVFMNGRAAAEK